jgi:hypothetical protein
MIQATGITSNCHWHVQGDSFNMDMEIPLSEIRDVRRIIHNLLATAP